MHRHPFRVELPLQPIWSYGLSVPRIRGLYVPTRRRTGDKPLRPQPALIPQGAVGSATRGERLLHLRQERVVYDILLGLGRPEIRIDSKHRDRLDTAHEAHGILTAMASDSGATDRDLFAKFDASDSIGQRK
jgi:hypothetical protein